MEDIYVVYRFMAFYKCLNTIRPQFVSPKVFSIDRSHRKELRNLTFQPNRLIIQNKKYEDHQSLAC